MEVVGAVSMQARNEKGCYPGTKTPILPPTASKPIPEHLQSVLSPRPFENIFFERQYLMTQADEQKARLIQDLRVYARIEHDLIGLEPSKERRRLRKKRALVRCRIDEGMRQNLMLCMRLIQVDIELQSREAKNSLRISAASSTAGSSSGGSTSTDSTSATSVSGSGPARVRTYKDSARDREARRNKGLNARSPEFVPLDAHGVVIAEWKVICKEEDEKQKIQAEKEEEEAFLAEERRLAEESEARNKELDPMDGDMLGRRSWKRRLDSVAEEDLQWDLPPLPPGDGRRTMVKNKAWRNPLPF